MTTLLFFIFLGQLLYYCLKFKICKRITDADIQSIRIANADGPGEFKT